MRKPMLYLLSYEGRGTRDNITTAGRTEVTALGDEVNEAARIEACATGGRALVSKNLLECLDAADAAELGLEPDRVTYVPLGELDTATEKARRAPAIAVCDVGGPEIHLEGRPGTR
jgi:class 3 adenylate cyclase